MANGTAALVLDCQEALARTDGDLDLLLMIKDLFLADYPKLLEEVRTAVAASDPPRLRRAAHTLKGSVGYFGAPAVCQAALDLELLGRSGNVHTAPDAFTALSQALDQFIPALIALGPHSFARV